MEKTLTKVKTSSSEDLTLYKELILSDNPSLQQDYNKLSLEINKNFNTSVTEIDLLQLEEPTITGMEEDYRLIYRHCVT